MIMQAQEQRQKPALNLISTEDHVIPFIKPSKSARLDMKIFQQIAVLLGNQTTEILGYFLEDAEIYISQMEIAARNQDMQKAVFPAHTLKSSSSQIGAISLAKFAAMAEELAYNSGSPQELLSLAPKMREELAYLKPFFS